MNGVKIMNYLLSNNDPGFPEQLYKIRKSLNITCEAFAELCGVSRSCIRRYEDKTQKDAVNPREQNWLKIKAGLDKINYFEDEGQRFRVSKKINLEAMPYKSFWQPIVNTMYIN